MSASTAPMLLRRPATAAPECSWDAAGRRVLDHESGFLRVLGGPGTGKTTLLAQAVVDRMVRCGVAPENIVVLTANRRAAASLRAQITRQLTADHTVRTATEPLVRTVHSYAFAVLRLQAMRDELPPPQLLNGPEQESLVRELLAGDVQEGARHWPEALRPALAIPGFAEELRNLLSRAAERGLAPQDLVDLGERHDRPEWVAAGTFARQYEEVTLLRGAASSGAAALDAAELVASALAAFDSDPELLAGERERVRHLFVDDAQHLDPQQYWLVRLLGGTAAEFLLAGDPDQAVFSFRGADPRLLGEADPEGARTVVLTTGHRMSPAVRTAVARLAANLPGSGPQRDMASSEPESSAPGSVRVRLLASDAQEASWIADQLRRAHLLDGVAWSNMAVVVRSAGATLPVLRRALLSAGVPLAAVEDQALGDRVAVRPLLMLLRCAAFPDSLDSELAATLLTSALGGADTLALRRLRRGLRRLELTGGGDRSSGELLVEALWDADRLSALEDSASAPVRRLAELLAVARTSVDAGDDLEQVLWKVWRASGLERRWLGLVERGGVAGAQADRDLDSIMALFDEAARYVDRLPGAGVGQFVESLLNQAISGSSLAPSAPSGDTVTLLTAHSATGREWDVVAIPGVQEGVWPDLRLRGTLLGVERLVDLLSGVDGSEVVSATAPLLAEERRLLLVAASRARSTLLVSAVRGDDDQPSRFLDELEGLAHDAEAAQRPVEKPKRGLVLAELVGELRRVVCDAESGAERRQRAAEQLARLAEAGVPGAHPDSWYGLPANSTDAPLIGADEPVRISPSTVDILAKCPLRWMIERHGGQDEAELAAVTGTLVHALIQKAAEGADAEQLRAELDRAWARVDAGAPWFSRKERVRVEAMLSAFQVWLVQSRAELTGAGVERDLDLKIPPRENGPWLRLRGRVDRLETDGEGNPVVIDVKTAKTPVSKDDAQEHPQLAVYQLAAALGAFADGETGSSGGARLLYVAKADRSGAATERGQDGFDQERMRVWLDVVHDAAASSLGPAYLAQENSDCSRCPARLCCPIHPSGRQVGS